MTHIYLRTMLVLAVAGAVAAADPPFVAADESADSAAMMLVPGTEMNMRARYSDNINSETMALGDPVNFDIVHDVATVVGGPVVVPRNSVVHCRVADASRGARLGGRKSRLALQCTDLITPCGRRYSGLRVKVVSVLDNEDRLKVRSNGDIERRGRSARSILLPPLVLGAAPHVRIKAESIVQVKVLNTFDDALVLGACPHDPTDERPQLKLPVSAKL